MNAAKEGVIIIRRFAFVMIKINHVKRIVIAVKEHAIGKLIYAKIKTMIMNFREGFLSRESKTVSYGFL